MSRKKIAILAGGDSGEYEVSINSGNVVQNSLDKEKYEAYLIIFQGSNWFCEIHDQKYFIDKNDFSLLIDDEKIRFDCVFIAIHGTPGEDGKVQGYLEMMNIPYSTSDWIVSALTFDKRYSKAVVEQFGILQANTLYFQKGDHDIKNKIIKELGVPCFLKPNKGGSSVGISRVMRNEELDEAIRVAFREDDEILAEEYIQGTEITCGVIRYKEQLIVMPLTEIVSKNDFFDYEAKYTKGMADEITPARVAPEIEKECKMLSSYLYNQLNCKGIVRFDYIFNEKGMFFLEANTVPGLSEASIVPQEAEEMGISRGELFEMAIEDALYRKEAGGRE
ncbi:MAG: D-alanine--D-alanine ligase [Bacteroidales bacterium]|nr:D-alanine--D-alanine ligase [Bacteroidales bacterium]MCF8387519.1 D-alanine--D-alanine ligase [Bacteroidales bacterium]MCF8398327.1 D-alanine--D-alanine ligase [Bacteroidales bacterium]